LAGHIDIDRLLIDNDASVDEFYNYGDTGLFMSYQKGYFNTFKFLIDNDVDIDQ
jgi:hypothetical protein